MPPEAKHFLADRFLKTIYKRKRYDHNHHTDDRGRNRQADNEPGKRFLLIESNAPGNEGGYVHNKKLLFRYRQTILMRRPSFTVSSIKSKTKVFK
jgi:hypothetical protein